MNKLINIKHKKRFQIIALSISVGLNFGMFAFEMTFCWIIHSLSMMGDAIDSFGDALTYGIALYAIVKLSEKKEDQTMLLGIVQVVCACILLEEIIRQQFDNNDQVENLPIFLGTSIVALSVNIVCAIMLGIGSQDKNVKAAFWFSSIDCFANIYTIVAALIMWHIKDKTNIPDLVGGILFFLLVSWAAIEIFYKKYRKNHRHHIESK